MTAPAYRLVRRPRRARPVPELDAAQRRVVEHAGGPLVVLAGPGTGKTTTLVEVAAARVEQGVPVENLLVLTFGRRAANELRDRITARLGRTVREPVARTFHSYAFGLLRMAAVAEGLPAPRLLSGPEQDVIIRDLLEGDRARGVERWPAALHPALSTRGFTEQLRDLLLRAVERGLSGSDLSELGRRQRRPDWIAAGEFLTEYQEVLSLGRPGAYDPAELIRAALAAMRSNGGLLAAERGRRRRILVDEYQDTDPAQAELLELLADGADELIVVGDPDQAIYGFRGAEASAMRGAAQRFARSAGRIEGRDDQPAETIALTTSRRAGTTLLAAGRRAALRLPGPVEHRQLIAAPELPPGRVEVRVLRSATEQAAHLATVLRRAHLEDGLPWSRMAVLVRSTTSSLPVLRRAFVSAGVPVAVRGEDLPLPDQPAVAHLITALRCVLDPSELTEDVAEQLLLGPIGRSDAIALRRVRREVRALSAAAGRPLDQPLSDLLTEPEQLFALPARLARPVRRVAAVFEAGRQAVRTGGRASSSVEDVLWSIWSASALAEAWQRASQAGGSIGAAADRDLDAVIELFAAAARFVDRLPNAAPVEFLEHLQAQQVPGDSLASRSLAGEAVHILTAHASKGLEWDLVCVADVQEGRWPDLRPRGSLLGSEVLVDLLAGIPPTGPSVAAALADERRLFYVAVTRARRRLVVTAVAGEDEQPSRLLDELDPVDGARPAVAAARPADLIGVVAELRAAVCDPAQPLAVRASAASELARLAEAGVRAADPDRWWGLADVSDDGPLADPLRLVPVSPSRIDAFRLCELRTVLTQLGASDRDRVAASLGTVIHDVARVAPPGAELSEFERLLDERWSSIDFGARWFADNERLRAQAMLARYVRWLAESRAELELLGGEMAFEVDTPSARVAGRVDRLERDGAGRLVVIDLKTGRSKVPADELASHPQLGAYQLAVGRGGFAGGDEAGGARLVQLGAGSGNVEQAQPPLPDHEQPTWVMEMIEAMAQRMRGARFTAAANKYCNVCDVASSCPVSGLGEQVTG
ncbi:MAG: ATP-dependent helicase [Actinobacteria bacterium]|nr:ATP-dependent helicase [Actinomycetota bacterium]